MKISASFEISGADKTKPNRDFALINQDLQVFMVCDGSTTGDGLAAAKTACQYIEKAFTRPKGVKALLDHYWKSPSPETRTQIRIQVENVIRECSHVIYAESQNMSSNKAGSSTTLDLLIVLPDYAFLFHVGDGRIIHYRSGSLKQCTTDQTLYAQMAASPEWKNRTIDPSFKADKASLGKDGIVKIEFQPIPLSTQDVFLLCTDGLYKGYSIGNIDKLSTVDKNDKVANVPKVPDKIDKALEDLLEKSDPQSISKKLVETAVQSKKTRDDITLLTVKIDRSEFAQVVKPAKDAKLPAQKPLGEKSAEQPKQWGDLTTTAILQKRFEIIKMIPFFFGIQGSQEGLNKVYNLTEKKLVKQGTTVIEIHQPSDEMYIILSGTADILVDGTSVSKQQAGSLIGEMGIFNNLPRTATVIAQTDMELLVIKRDHLLEFIKREPELGISIYTSVIEELSLKLARLTNKFAEQQDKTKKA